MKTRIVALLLLAITASIFIGLSLIKIPSKRSADISNKKIKVTATFYPLAFFAEKIGGDKAEVLNLTPTGVEPHDYEPTPSDLTALYSSQIFIYNGAGLEGWVEKVLPDLVAKGILIVKASDGVDLIGKPPQTDPHIWLDPVLAQRIVLNIKDSFIKVDPQNSQYYTDNSDDLIVKLVNLDRNFQRSLSNCQNTEIVTSHEAFAYLSRRYKFGNLAISGLSPDEEPSPQKMAEIVGIIKDKKIKYILTETLVSPKLADTLAKEVGASTLVFNPLEGLTREEVSKGEDYFTIQDANLKTLITALQCQSI